MISKRNIDIHYLAANKRLGGIANSEVIPTTDGYKAVGELQSGDTVFNYYGMPTKVGILPEDSAVEVYNVIFEDGRSVKMSKDQMIYYAHADKFSRDDDTSLYEHKSLADACLDYERRNGIAVPTIYAIQPNLETEIMFVGNDNPYHIGQLVAKGDRELKDDFLFVELSCRHAIIKGLFDEKGDIDDYGVTLNCDGVIPESVWVVRKLLWSYGYVNSYDHDAKVLHVHVFTDNGKLWFFDHNDCVQALNVNKDDDLDVSPCYKIDKIVACGKEKCTSIFVLNDGGVNAVLMGYGFIPVSADMKI